MTGSEDYEQRESRAVHAGKSQMSPEFSDRRVGKGGLFAEVRENKSVYPKHYMLLATDGVGSKLFLSQWLDDYKTIGHDLVAMNINDLATFGKVIPDAINVYFAVQSKVEEEKMGDIVKGIDDALERCIIPGSKFNINYGKFETASLDEMISGPVPGYGFDVAATATAFIEKKRMPDFDPKPGDVIVGFGSEGLQSNGYTAARHVLLDQEVEPREEFREQYTGRFGLDDRIPGSDITVGKALIRPTEIFLRAMYRIADSIRGAYGVNITGYGLKNFNRFGKRVRYALTLPFEPRPIHKLLMDEGKYAPEEAWTKWNMGMGFAVIVKDHDAARAACSIAEEEGHTAKVVGKVIESDCEEPSVILYLPDEASKYCRNYEFNGYG